jgi:hypothetical protein
LIIFQYRKWSKNKLLSLIAQRLLINIAIPSHGIADVSPEIRWYFGQLDGEGSKEFINFDKIISAFRKEEIYFQIILIVKSLGDRTSDNGFAGINYTVQLKNIFIVRIVSLRHQLSEKIDSNIGEALKFVLTKAGVKSGISNIK